MVKQGTFDINDIEQRLYLLLGDNHLKQALKRFYASTHSRWATFDPILISFWQKFETRIRMFLRAEEDPDILEGLIQSVQTWTLPGDIEIQV